MGVTQAATMLAEGVASNILKRSRVCYEQRISASAHDAEGLADS